MTVNVNGWYSSGNMSSKLCRKSVAFATDLRQSLEDTFLKVVWCVCVSMCVLSWRCVNGILNAFSVTSHFFGIKVYIKTLKCSPEKHTYYFNIILKLWRVHFRIRSKTFNTLETGDCSDKVHILTL